jgi:hypothetical protein
VSEKTKPLIHVNDLMQSDYSYTLIEPMGENFDPDFRPAFTPQEMLEYGVFEGKYLNDCRDEFPAEWYKTARLSDKPDASINCFGIKSRQPLQVWQEKGWIIGPDPRGWFQWYCRYYMGRRLADVDTKQIKRWRAFTRHLSQVRINCHPLDFNCRPRQRQGLLQWSYDPFI